MNCPKCGALNEDNALFCKQCGAPFTSGDIAGTPPTVTYAGFWKRFAAYIIDGLILCAASAIILFPTGLMKFADPFDSFWSSPITLAISWLYFALMESSSKQATVGKMVLGIKVIDNMGKKVSFGRATGRYFSKILSGIIICIGFLMIAFTEKKQGLHDMLANTLVVNK